MRITLGLFIFLAFQSCSNVNTVSMKKPCFSNLKILDEGFSINGSNIEYLTSKKGLEYLVSIESADSSKFYVNLTCNSIRTTNKNQYPFQLASISAIRTNSVNFEKMKRMGFTFKSEGSEGEVTLNNKSDRKAVMGYLNTSIFDEFHCIISVNALNEGVFFFPEENEYSKNLCYSRISSDKDAKCNDSNIEVVYYPNGIPE